MNIALYAITSKLSILLNSSLAIAPRNYQISVTDALESAALIIVAQTPSQTGRNVVPSWFPVKGVF
jgi:hypothetical protein